MPIDSALLTKAAKVYEASEPVEGEKPKEVYESHKKCAPGEFGMNKEGEETVPGMAERSYLAMAQHDVNRATAPTGWQTQENRQRQALFPLLGASVGKLVGGDAGRFWGHTVGTGLSAYGAYENALSNAQQLRAGQGHDTAIADYGFAKQRGLNYKPAEEPPQLPQAQPRPPIKMPPRGVGPRPAGMNKSGTVGLTGALLGALGGAATADRGRVNEGAGRGAVIGAGTELGALAGLVPGGALGSALGYGLGGASGAGLGALAGGGLGALGGGVLGNSAAHGLVGPYKKDNKEKKDEKDMKKESAYSFGGRVKQALDPAVGYGAAGGGLLGAGLGGLAGFINPGEEEDEDGRVRQRSRFGAALRGALGGGAAGALGGGALGHFSPGTVNGLQQMLFGAPKQQAPTTTRKMMPLPGGRQVFAMPGVKTPEALAAEREQYLAEQAKKNQPVPPSEEIQLVPPTGL